MSKSDIVPVDNPPPGADLVTNILTASEFEAVVVDYLGRERTPSEIAVSRVQPLLAEEPSE